MDLHLKGKFAIVTGASRGIGRSIATAFAREGAGIAVCAREGSALEDAACELRSLGVAIYAEPCDVSIPEDLDRFLDRSRQALGDVDILVNNASGFGMDDDEASWHAGWSVDVMASVRASRRVVPWMEARGGGAIVHISSVCALEANALPAYSAAKAALMSHARTMAPVLAQKGIRINVVAPGSIEFPGGYWDRVRRENPAEYAAVRSTVPFGRLGTPEEVASAVAFLASSRASWISGTTIVVDGVQNKGSSLLV